jgi:demethylmenaquinone methyltransferase/2-methoxy-6-polyprenyl-1,4-benzoquinol methylase
MFDRIAGRYDLLNRVISFRLDTWWRAQAIRTILTNDHPLIVDLGTGTGDLAFNAARMTKGKASIIGLDFSMQMIQFAQTKRAEAKFGSSIAFIQASAMSAPLQSEVFDGAMTAFVLRNISDLSFFFADAFRVSNFGFDEDVSTYWHDTSPWPAAALAAPSSVSLALIMVRVMEDVNLRPACRCYVHEHWSCWPYTGERGRAKHIDAGSRTRFAP